MDGDLVRQFNSDKEIKEYIEKGIGSINILDECRLYREEQLQITEDVMRARNSTEWIIRINKVINNCTYAMAKSYEYAMKMNWPLEETKILRCMLTIWRMLSIEILYYGTYFGSL